MILISKITSDFCDSEWGQQNLLKLNFKYLARNGSFYHQNLCHGQLDTSSQLDLDIRIGT